MSRAQISATARASMLRDAAKAVSAATVIGAMAVTFALSLAVIIYTGPLAPYLSQGIGLTLVGTIIMSLIAPLVMSYRGTLVQPQDVSTVILSLAAASVAALPGISGQAAFSTIVVLVAVTSVATGLAAYAMGRLKLGYIVRFVPYPVIRGFLAASGALLVRGAVDMVVPGGEPAGDLVAQWPRWAPWLLVAVAIALASRMWSNPLLIPAALTLTLSGFYAIAAGLSLDFAALRDLGVLLGPFQGKSFASGLSLDIVSDVQWSALFTLTPVIATIVGMSLLGTLLNASGLELAVGRDIDFDRDLKGIGIANIAA